MELARKILDELLGPERNKMPNEKGSFGVKFYDPDVSATNCWPIYNLLICS